MRQSTISCLVMKSNPSVCRQTAHAYCLHPKDIRAWSPRVLGELAVIGGPIWVWAPLLIWLFLHRGGLRQESAHPALLAATRKVLAVCCCVFLAFIMPIRYMGRMTDWFGGFDPSGHVFVFGLQLVPLWVLLTLRSHFDSYAPVTDVSADTDADANADAPDPDRIDGCDTSAAVADGITGGSPNVSPPPVHRQHRRARGAGCTCIGGTSAGLLWSARIAEACIWYLSAATASFFHTGAEVLVSYLITLVLAVYCSYSAENVIHSADKEAKDGGRANGKAMSAAPADSGVNGGSTSGAGVADAAALTADPAHNNATDSAAPTYSSSLSPRLVIAAFVLYALGCLFASRAVFGVPQAEHTSSNGGLRAVHASVFYSHVSYDGLIASLLYALTRTRASPLGHFTAVGAGRCQPRQEEQPLWAETVCCHRP